MFLTGQVKGIFQTLSITNSSEFPEGKGEGGFSHAVSLRYELLCTSSFPLQHNRENPKQFLGSKV